MHRSLTLAGSLLAASTVAPLAIAPAASGAADAEALPEITVTAPTRTRRAIERTPAATEVITEEAIQRSGATMLDEALRSESSLFIGPDGDTFSIRGGGRTDIIYLIDGRRIRGTSGRGYELNRIPVSHVERVEIVKGPGSVAYGSDAIAGVINVITRKPEPGLEGSAEVETGAPTDGQGGQRDHGALYLGGGNADTRWRLLADALERDAYAEPATAEIDTRPPTDELAATYGFDEDHREEADVYNLRAGLTHWLTRDLRLDLEAGVMDGERRRDFTFVRGKPAIPTGVQEGSQTVKADRFPARLAEDSRRRDLAAEAEWLATEDLELRYRLYESRFEMERSNTFLLPQAFGFETREASEFGPRDVTLTDRVNDLQATWRPNERHTVLTGLKHTAQSYRDHELSEDPEHDQWVGGAFAQHEWQATERLDLVYGARYDDSSVDVDNTALQAGSVYRLHPAARIRAQYAEGFKVPELRSYFVDTTGPSGKRVLGTHFIEGEELDPERSRNYELGLAGELVVSGAVQGRYDLGVFYTEFDDRITKTRATTTDKAAKTFRNVDDARAQGAELDLGLALEPALELQLAATYLDAINRDTGETLAHAPEWNAVASVLWQPAGPVELQLRTRYVDEVYDGTEWESAYTLTSLDAEYAPAAWDGVTLQAGVDNLLDNENDSSLYADPGRFVRAGIRYDF